MSDTFVAIWPILDDQATLPVLIGPAQELLEALAEEAGVKLAGPVAWRLDVDRLVATAAAVPLPHRVSRPLPWDDRESLREGLAA